MQYKCLYWKLYSQLRNRPAKSDWFETAVAVTAIVTVITPGVEGPLGGYQTMKEDRNQSQTCSSKAIREYQAQLTGLQVRLKPLQGCSRRRLSQTGRVTTCSNLIQKTELETVKEPANGETWLKPLNWTKTSQTRASENTENSSRTTSRYRIQDVTRRLKPNKAQQF